MASMEFHLLPIFVLFSLVLAAMAVGRSDILLPDKKKILLIDDRSTESAMSKVLQKIVLDRGTMIKVLQKIVLDRGTMIKVLQKIVLDRGAMIKVLQKIVLDRGAMIKVLQKIVFDQSFAEDSFGPWRYDQSFAEDTFDRPLWYRKRYEQSFAEDTLDRPPWYVKRYEQPFTEDTTYRRQKYGRRYELKFNKHALSNSNVQKDRVHITKSANKARILPRQVADSLPFSTNKLAEIMKRFSVDPESRQGKMLKQTVENCESPGIKGEDRFCPTSLESLVDFSVKHVGNKAQYTIKEVKFIGENYVVCHKLHYPYAVYYCHALKGTKVYTAQVVGADGTKAKAVAVCHTDTSAWNPGSLAFLVLKMKPGEGTVCHFIRSDTFVMVSN
uniref:BURP domain-containing protein n=1 Tax=Manihot esculenta TaxID=3983 RepID=A0A2C9VTF4_MANES